MTDIVVALYLIVPDYSGNTHNPSLDFCSEQYVFFEKSVNLSSSIEFIHVPSDLSV